MSPELTGDSRCEHQAESCSLGRSTLSTDVARAQGTPQGSGHTPGLALRESHCFIAGPENPLLGCRAKLWHHDGSAQQATWASTLPGSCSTKAHLCKSSFQTKCPLHGRSQEAYLLTAPPLWLHGACSNLPGLVPHITAQQTRESARTSPVVGHRVRGAGYLASVAGSKDKDGALQVLSTAAHLRHHRDTAYLVAFFLLLLFLNQPSTELCPFKLQLGFPDGSDRTQSTCNAEDFLTGSGRSLEKEMATHSVCLPEKPHGQRSLVGYTVHGLAKSWTQLSIHKPTHGINYT